MKREQPVKNTEEKGLVRMKAYLLAGGMGRRLWPFAEYRNKAALPIGNLPLARRTADAAFAAGIEELVVAASHMAAELKKIFLFDARVTVVETKPTAGSAETLEAAVAASPFIGDAMVLFGDCLYSEADLYALAQTHAETQAAVTALLSPVMETGDSGDRICAQTDADGRLRGFAGHTEAERYQVLEAFLFKSAPPVGSPFLPYLSAAGVFEGAGIGGMPPRGERHVETALALYAGREGSVPACIGAAPFVDIDKPWQIMEACWLTVRAETSALSRNKLADGAAIDPTARLAGFVQLGRNSRIGRNVTVNGNIIVGDDTLIDNGAVLDGDMIIGDHTRIENYCYIGGGSTVGSRCKILHAAEFDGVLLDGAYLYHYMEIDGLIGKNVDIGASCVCGTLRFDNKASRHDVCGRKETPRNFANATYIGDYSRTGVNCTFYPGVTIGCHCAIGPGVVVTENIESNQMVLVKQELIRKPWGPEKYGW